MTNIKAVGAVPLLPDFTDDETKKAWASQLSTVLEHVNKSRPPLDSTVLLSADPAQHQMLEDIYETLTKLHVRNRNQHQKSHWYKDFSQFRKGLGDIIRGLKDGGPHMVEALNLRLQLWDSTQQIHSMYFAFLQIVASRRFAVLGLVLMACVARVCKITGISAVYEDKIVGSDVKTVLNTIDNRTVAHVYGGIVGGDEDEGEVIPRV